MLAILKRHSSVHDTAVVSDLKEKEKIKLETL